MTDSNDARLLYWTHYADQLISGLGATAEIKKFTKNPAIIGAQAEVIVKKLVAEMVTPFRVSTGSIINPALADNEASGKHSHRQIDSIIWSPMPLPAIFEVDNFGLIPGQSVLAALEIKRSLYPGAVSAAIETMDWIEENAEGAKGKCPKWVIEKTMQAKGKLVFLDGVESKKLEEAVADRMWSSLLVICLKESKQSSPEIEDLVTQGRAVVLLEEADGDFKANRSHVLHLVDFLTQCRIRYENFLSTKRSAASGIKAQVADRNSEVSPGSIWKPATT